MTGEAGGGHTPREEFAQRLTQLWEAAGNPTLQRVADAANQRMAAAAGPATKKVNAQRISDWRRGRNLPAKFDTVRPVLLTVIELARKSGTEVPPGLLNLGFWRQLWLKSAAWTPDSSCPYRGLESFRSGDAKLFFGRDRAITELVALVDKTAEGGGGVAVLLGASGAGKSSLLAAGLIPHLGAEWTAAQCTPGAHPADSLAAALATPAPGRRLVVIDQFEELFTAGAAEEERAAFLDTLRGLDKDGVTAILGVRADFFARCLDYPVLAEAINQRSYVLGAMGETELADAITKPAQLSGLKLENGLTDLIIAELTGLGGTGHDGSGTLPLLSHVMEATWNHRDGNRLTVAGYREVGGVAGSVAKTADDAWHELTPDARSAAKDLMLALVTVGQDTRDTRRQVPPAELLTRAPDPDAALAALETLARARLITLDQDAASLTHEVVLDAWPQLRKWIDADREGLLIRQRAEIDAAEWISSGRSRNLLYRGDRLRRAREFQRGLTGAGTEFLTAAHTARRRLLWLQAGLAMFVVVLMVAAVAGYVTNTLTGRERDAVFFADVVSEADRVQSSDPTLSAELDVLARRLDSGDRSVDSRLIAASNLPISTTFADHHGDLRSIVYLDDGLLATAGDDGAIRTWSVGRPGIITPVGDVISDPGQHVTHLAAHGSTLAAGTREHLVRIRDMSEPGHPRLLHDVDTGAPVIKVALSSDGHTLAVAHEHEAQLWDITKPDQPQQIPTKFPVEDPLQNIWFASQDRAIITRSQATVNTFATADTLLIWPLDPTEPVAHSTVLGHSGGLQIPALSGDGNLVAIGDFLAQQSNSGFADSKVRFVRVDDPTNPQAVAEPFSAAAVFGLSNLVISPDGRMLATETDQGVTLWNLADLSHPVTLGPPLTGTALNCPGSSRRCTEPPGLMRFSPDGHFLTVALQGGTVEQWSLPAGVLTGQAGQTEPLTLSSDGRRMLTVGVGADAHIWDIHDPAETRLIGTIPKPQFRFTNTPATPFPAISYDGNYAGLAFHDAMTLIDISDAEHPRETYTFTDSIALAFAPNRAVLVAIYGGISPHFQLWDYSHPDHPDKLGPPVLIPLSSKLRDIGLRAGTSRDGQRVALVSGTLQLWDLTGDIKPTPTGSVDLDWQGGGMGVVISPDHSTLVMGWDAGTLRIWDIHDPHKITALTDPVSVSGTGVSSIDISPDGRSLAVGGQNSSVQVWSIDDPKHPVLQGRSLSPAGSTEWQVAFHPTQNRYLFGAGDDGTLRVWDLDPATAVQRICTLTASTIADDLAAHFPGRHLPHLC
ncbi:WD40 repeat domain-containing protein [Nocardia sp. CDC160]|uniref:WD40 repeat domain-containing protein n=1 Tax=Nocardia sp. CDC160 TaxID=3112166 RepID=UPI002DBF549E|nr:WD40 repeat domain-containing protein [Nocardia sp. CDC160]MEC3918433.1 WD40 repeat domain-containing protein [Nocardia sp. CDC160]